MPFSATQSAKQNRPRGAAIIAFNVVAVLAVFTAIAAVPTGSRVVVVAPPWHPPERVLAIVAEAGGTLVNGGRASWLTVAEGSSPDFVNRLFKAGAMFILDGKLAAACIKEN